MNKHEFVSKAALNAQLATDVQAILAAAIAQKGIATLVVSGGSTPLAFFGLLSKADIDWSRVTVTLADERCVAATHEDSNEKLVREHLLINKAAPAQFVSLLSDGPVAVAVLPTFDVLILGMGEDGHTASLFPKASNLTTALAMDSAMACIKIDPITAPYQRISMTLPRLLASQHIYVHVTGSKKMSVLNHATRAKTRTELPISAVLQQQVTPVSVYWAA